MYLLHGTTVLYVGVCTYTRSVCRGCATLPLHLLNHYSDVQMQPVDHITTRSEYLGLVDGTTNTACGVVRLYHRTTNTISSVCGVTLLVGYHPQHVARVHALCGVSS